ncbi:MAG: hypothetical protein II565_02165 [Fibrobacter sp.]|nr:hypothetical protein [Fibrobacter sp.]
MAAKKGKKAKKASGTTISKAKLQVQSAMLQAIPKEQRAQLAKAFIWIDDPDIIINGIPAPKPILQAKVSDAVKVEFLEVSARVEMAGQEYVKALSECRKLMNKYSLS